MQMAGPEFSPSFASRGKFDFRRTTLEAERNRKRRNDRKVEAIDESIAALNLSLSTGKKIKSDGSEGRDLTQEEAQRRGFQVEVLEEAKLGILAPGRVDNSLTPQQRVLHRRRLRQASR